MNFDLVELPLADVAPGGPWRAKFVALHRDGWINDGVARWLDVLIAVPPPHPIRIAAALTREAPPRLAGTVVAVWATTPLERFDDILDRAPERPITATAGGAWHMFAATVAAEFQSAGAARPLLDFAIENLTKKSPRARIMTISPAIGIVDAARMLFGGGAFDYKPARAEVVALLTSFATADGKPLLPIERLHLGAGATLNAVLFDSRRDEKRGGGINLRFEYAREPAARAAQAGAYRDWAHQRVGATAQHPEWRVELTTALRGALSGALRTKIDAAIFDCRALPRWAGFPSGA